MSDKGLTSPGDTGMDIGATKNVSDTNPGSVKGGGKGPVDFMGDGNKDVSQANTPPLKGGSLPSGKGNINFAGDVDK